MEEVFVEDATASCYWADRLRLRDRGTTDEQALPHREVLDVPGGRFPIDPVPFCVFGTLIDGLGEAEVTLTVTRLDTNEDISESTQRVRFPERLAEVNVLFRLANCTFPVPGSYQVALFVDDDLIAQRRIRVLPVGA